jgi:hypothetical protein
MAEDPKHKQKQEHQQDIDLDDLEVTEDASRNVAGGVDSFSDDIYYTSPTSPLGGSALTGSMA